MTGMEKFFQWLATQQGNFRIDSVGGKRIRNKRDFCPLQAWTGFSVGYVKESERRGFSVAEVYQIIDASDGRRAFDSYYGNEFDLSPIRQRIEDTLNLPNVPVHGKGDSL